MYCAPKIVIRAWTASRRFPSEGCRPLNKWAVNRKILTAYSTVPVCLMTSKTGPLVFFDLLYQSRATTADDCCTHSLGKLQYIDSAMEFAINPAHRGRHSTSHRFSFRLLPRPPLPSTVLDLDLVGPSSAWSPTSTPITVHPDHAPVYH